MPRRAPLVTIIFGALLAAGAMLGFGVSGSRAATPTLNVTFNADNSLTVTFNGAPVGAASAPGTVIPAGAYQVIVDNQVGAVGLTFHLTGPGVNLVTDVDGGEQAAETWDETFQPSSTYTYFNDTVPSSTRVFSTASSTAGSTSSSSASTSPPKTAGGSQSNTAQSNTAVGSTTKTTSAPVVFRGALAARVGAAGKLTLTSKGKSVTTLKSGDYRISVTDTTPKSSFLLQEIRDPPITVSSTLFVGVRWITVDLKPGQWFFYANALGRKRPFVVVG